ncbi:hypothetical protein [Neorhizobium sp. JUb45]|uniref:hypothetical protein n=1 Tax=Neorhizobium sp. JUb45 TaxID=2485113 RepID=UPI0010CE6E0B|nr:hypothetical protein [Neorhizobium sp. JUb45]TCQ97979.1 hypothetical protein EDF70_11245 [Neorhizobium sp. JUb45]
MIIKTTQLAYFDPFVETTLINEPEQGYARYVYICVRSQGTRDIERERYLSSRAAGPMP